VRAILVSAFGAADVLEVSELPDPEPADGEVIVRIRAVGVNPVDAYVRSGQYARLPPLPYIPGFDAAGEIESVPAGMSEWSPGDRVWISTLGSWRGTYADRGRYPADQIYRLPDAISFEAGAALGVPAATAHRAVFGRGQAKSGETVLVHGGSGAVGIAAIQLARAAGLRVFATAGSDEGRAAVEEAGAEQVFDHHDPGRAERVRQITEGRGVDLIIEMLASANLDVDLTMIGMRGRIVVVGSRGRIEIDPRFTMAKDATVAGMALWNVPAQERIAINHALVSALDQGTLAPRVGPTFPFDQAPRAHEALFEEATRGKIVLVP
jgi:NADPH2:quinone reductase